MAISRVDNSVCSAKCGKSYPVSKGKNIGTGAGFALGVTYAARNLKDDFVHAAKDAAGKSNVSTKEGKIIAAGVMAAAVVLSTAAGRVIGGVIGKAAGKIAENHNQKHQAGVTADDTADNMK